MTCLAGLEFAGERAQSKPPSTADKFHSPCNRSVRNSFCKSQTSATRTLTAAKKNYLHSSRNGHGLGMASLKNFADKYKAYTVFSQVTGLSKLPCITQTPRVLELGGFILAAANWNAHAVTDTENFARHMNVKAREDVREHFGDLNFIKRRHEAGRRRCLYIRTKNFSVSAKSVYHAALSMSYNGENFWGVIQMTLQDWQILRSGRRADFAIKITAIFLFVIAINRPLDFPYDIESNRGNCTDTT